MFRLVVAFAKHWFQDDKPGIYKPKSSIVLVLFRDPIDWVNALREVSLVFFFSELLT